MSYLDITKRVLRERRRQASSELEGSPSEWPAEAFDHYDERLAIMQFDGGLPESLAVARAEADTRAWWRVRINEKNEKSTDEGHDSRVAKLGRPTPDSWLRSAGRPFFRFSVIS